MAIPPSLNSRILTSEARWRRGEQRGPDDETRSLCRARRFLWLMLIVPAVGVLSMSPV